MDKSEARNLKSETNSNTRDLNSQKEAPEFDFSSFGKFGRLNLPFVSGFDIRISDLIPL